MQSTKTADRETRSEATFLEMQLPADLSAGLERYVAGLPEPRPTEAEAVRQILSDWLCAHGFLKGDDDGISPAELNSSNDD